MVDIPCFYVLPFVLDSCFEYYRLIFVLLFSGEGDIDVGFFVDRRGRIE